MTEPWDAETQKGEDAMEIVEYGGWKKNVRLANGERGGEPGAAKHRAKLM